MKKLGLILAIVIGFTFLFGESPPGWSVDPHKFEYTGSVVAEVNGVGYKYTDGDVLAVFSGENECRGVSQVLYFPRTGTNLYFIMVYTNSADNVQYSVKYYSAGSDSIYNLGVLFVYPNMRAGTPLVPVEYTIPNVVVDKKREMNKISKSHIKKNTPDLKIKRK